MKLLTRRRFLSYLTALAGWSMISPILPASWRKRIIQEAHADTIADLFVSKNGTPVSNMKKVIDMAGGISAFVESDDIVIIKPNLQWMRQGYTHTQATMALIDIILNRPAGFSGEIIIAENIFADVASTLKGWAASMAARVNNWEDMNYNELISWYHNQGALNVTAAKLISEDYPVVSSPSEGQGFVEILYTISESGGANGRICRLYYPIIQSSYSGKMIDTKNGVWTDGGYTGQSVKLIFLPTLNNHGTTYEDYAGATSAVKCHLGFMRSLWGEDNTHGLHSVGYQGSPVYPNAVGEAVGELITSIVQPTLYITVAEYSGWEGRTSTTGAEHTKTIGLCKDPVTLDYWMGKNVLAPCNGGIYASFLDPSNSCHFRETLEGCQAKGVGTLNEAEMAVHLYDFDTNAPSSVRTDIDRKIMEFKDGSATQQDVIDLIDDYMESSD